MSFNHESDLNDLKKLKWMGVVFFAAAPMIVLAGVFFLYRGITDAKACVAAQSWPVAQGMVVRSDMDSEKHMNRRGIETTTYDLNIEYVYSVEGVAYAGDQVTLGMLNRTSEKTTYQLLNTFPEGATVDVRYDPQLPSRAVLTTSVPLGTKFDLGVGSIIAVLNIGMGLLIFKWTREGRQDEVVRAAEPAVPADAAVLYGRPI